MKRTKILVTFLIVALAAALLCGTAFAAGTDIGTLPADRNSNLSGTVYQTVGDTGWGADLPGEASTAYWTGTGNGSTVTVTGLTVRGGEYNLTGDIAASVPITVTGGTLNVKASQGAQAITVTGGALKIENNVTIANLNGGGAAGGTIQLAGNTTISGGTCTVSGATGGGTAYGLTVKGTANVTMDGTTSLKYVKLEAGTLDLAGAVVKNEDSSVNDGCGVWASGGVLKGTKEEAHVNTIQGVEWGIGVNGTAVVQDFYNYAVSVTGDAGNALAVVSGTAAFTDCDFTNSNAANNDSSIVLVNGSGKLTLTGGKIAPTGANTNKALHVNSNNDAVAVTLSGTEVISNNPDHAVYIDTNDTPPVTFTDGTTVTSHGLVGVYLDNGANFIAKSDTGATTTITADIYGIYIDGDDAGNKTKATLGAGALVDMYTAAAGNCYGVYATGADSIFTMTGGEIYAAAVSNSDTAYGVYVDTGATANISGGEINVMPVSDSISSARLEGVRNEAGTVNVSGGVITLDAYSNNNNIFGLFNKAEATVSGGEIVVMGGGDGSARGIQNQGNTKFTGGKLTMTGNGNYGVYNADGLFEMGAHGQTTVAANAGEATHPYIHTTNAHNSYGIYNMGGSAKIYAGTIDITSTGSVGVYVDNGNLQVLANAHDAPIAATENTVLNVTVNGTGGEAFAAAGGNWAIRGRGSLFTANTALNVTDSASTDGGFWHNGNCNATTAGTPENALSGGTFIGAVKVSGGKVADLLLQNHYLRDAKTYTEYNVPTDGDIPVVDADAASVSNVTVVDAEWELRYALEIDNDINDYYMPVDIILDAAHEVHGTGPQDGDVDVDSAADDTTDEANTGYHTLDLTDKTLSYDGSDTNVTTEPVPAVPSVIQVSDGGKLITVASGRYAQTEAPYATKGNIKFGNTVDGVAVHVKGGEYNNGTPGVEGVFEDDGAILEGSTKYDTSNNLLIDGGAVNLNSGMVGWENSSYSSVYVKGGELIVNGGEIYGHGRSETSLYFMGIRAEGGKTTIRGGTIRGDRLDYRTNDVLVYGDEAQFLLETLYAHDIGNVRVAKGRFDLRDGSYMTGEGEDAVLTPSTIRSLKVIDHDTGSAYVSGGVILEDSAVENGELLVNGGVFEKDLAISNGTTIFVPQLGEPEAGQDIGPIEKYGTVKGTVNVTNNGALLVEYGDFGTVTTNTDGSAIALHGGLYGTISTTQPAGQNAYQMIGSEAFGRTSADISTIPGMIPANHALMEQGSSAKYYRTDKDSESAAAGKKMEIVAIDLEDMLTRSNIKLPCFIDLNYTVSEAQDGPVFRNAFSGEDESDITKRRTEIVVHCGIIYEGPWEIKEGENKTLDLNGYSITNSDELDGVITISGGALTVKDGTNTDGRIFDDKASSLLASCAVELGSGSFNMMSGAIYGNEMAAVVQHSGTATIGGTSVLYGADTGYAMYGFRGEATLNISGGTFAGRKTDALYVSVGSSACNVNISGGKFYGMGELNTGDPREGSGLEIYGGDLASNIDITGGEFYGFSDGVSMFGEASVLKVSGGAFYGGVDFNAWSDPGYNGPPVPYNREAGGAEYYGMYVDSGKATLTGGKYSGIMNAIVGGDNGEDTLGAIIPSGTTVKAENAPPRPSANTQVNNISPVPTDNDKVVNAFKMKAPDATTPVTIPRDTYKGHSELSDDDLIDYDLTKSVTVEVDGVTYTADVTSQLDYRSMFTLSTGGYVPGPGPTPPPLETEDHFAYVQGYPDGSFKPEGNITRAEAAVMFYRLLTDKVSAMSLAFKDVDTDHWAYKEIQTLASRKIIEGYPGGLFYPENTITRAEFCAMASRFFDLKTGSISFTDVTENHWAYKYIASAAGYGWIEAGETKFRPDEAITRAEAVVIVNNMLGREADKDYVDQHLSAKYSDVPKTHKAYYDIMEASFGHEYTKTNGKETWTGLK